MCSRRERLSTKGIKSAAGNQTASRHDCNAGDFSWKLGAKISLEANHSLSALREVSNGGMIQPESGNRNPRCEENVLVIPTHTEAIVIMWMQDGACRASFVF